jgi:hypothetical protein
LLVKLHSPDVSLVCLSFIDGKGDVLQHIPAIMISSPPSDTIFPPDVTVVWVISFGSVVVKMGGDVLSFLHECKIIVRMTRTKPMNLTELFMVGNN